MSRRSRATPRRAAERLRPLLELPAAAALAALPADLEALLVGGALRDRLLGRPVRDLDAVVAREGAAAARALAEHLETRVIELGGDRFAAYRLVTPELRLDLWDRGEMSLEDDLRRRDFTVNSMALRVSDAELIDPAGGLEDLERRTLRATSERSFAEDPLRVLRLVRFATELPGFAADPGTLRLARAAANGLRRVAAERVREELESLFGGFAAAAALDLLSELGLYPELWSGAPIPDLSLRSVRRRLDRLDRRASRRDRPTDGWAVDRAVAAQAVLFAGLPESAVRLRDFHRRRLLSNRPARAIERLLALGELPRSDPERRWFLHRAGELWPTAAAFVGSVVEDAEWRATRTVLGRLARTEAEAVFTPRPLLDGHQIAELLGIEPGPRLGELAGALRRAQIERRVTTPEEAVAWLRRRQDAPAR